MIDLDAYLARIAYTGPREPTLPVLQAVCRQHPAHIVYENIDALLGTAPSLQLAPLQDKLLRQGRGGYCFEQNLLLKEALTALGMQVAALAARVVWMQPADAPPRPRTHMLLHVRVPGQSGDYLADVGFGGQLMNLPLLLQPGLEQRGSLGLMRVIAEGGAYSMQTHLPAGWAPMYRFTLDAQTPADYEPLNWYTATHPGSIFRHNLLLERLTPELRAGLFNDRLMLRRPGEPPAPRRLGPQAEFEEVLSRHFGLQLPQAVLGALYERVPKGLDQFVVPASP